MMNLILTLFCFLKSRFYGLHVRVTGYRYRVSVRGFVSDEKIIFSSGTEKIIVLTCAMKNLKVAHLLIIIVII